MLRDKPRWWIAKDSLGIVALGKVYGVTYCYNLEKKCVFLRFYNNTSKCSLGVFTAELICMQRWACELA